MPSIKVLKKEISALIAAGEVVERPASVVKELVENSIDAGAQAITVEIFNGGMTMMRVTDDGCGISREDSGMVFSRHATSKIETEEDLFHIESLGFRGEAMYAIASVSKVDMISRVKEEQEGTHLVIQGGETVSVTGVGCPVGTTIVVKDLFYNTPARKKFLKKDVTEGGAIATVVERVALSRSDISFKFIKDGKEEFATGGDRDLKNAIYSVLGREIASAMIPVDYNCEGVSIRGMVSEPLRARANRNLQLFYINSRYIKSKLFSIAVEEAYKEKIVGGKFPMSVLFMQVDPALVDINVHPSKLEARFSNDKPVYNAIYFAVKSALMQNNDENNSLVHKSYSGVDSSYLYKEETSNTLMQSGMSNMDIHNIFTESVVKLPVSDTETFFQPSLEVDTSEEEQHKIEIGQSNLEDCTWRIVGEFFKTYIVVEIKDEILIVDKHAVHERMIYERLKTHKKAKASQILIDPVAISMTREERQALDENKEFFEDVGFEFEDFGGGSVLIRNVPMDLDDMDLGLTILEMLGTILQSKNSIQTEAQDRALYTLACKAAIKANMHNDAEELSVLVSAVLSNSEMAYCPHGRPTTFRMTQKEIEKKFKRII